jgi:hypothetical protein
MISERRRAPAYADAPDVERRISSPTVEDMQELAQGGQIDLGCRR